MMKRLHAILYTSSAIMVLAAASLWMNGETATASEKKAAPSLKKASEEALHQALKAANPMYAGDAQFKYQKDKLIIISLMRCKNLRDTRPLAAFDLSSVKSIVCYNAVDLEDLGGIAAAINLQQLNLERCAKITDLSPLKGLPIRWIRMYAVDKVQSLEPLRGMPLGHLDIGKCTSIEDISVLSGMPITDLRLDECPRIKDISVLADFKALEFLSLFQSTGIKDYSALKHHSTLKTLLISPELLSDGDLQMVRDMSSLKLLGSSWDDWSKKMTPEKFWERYKDSGNAKGDKPR